MALYGADTWTRGKEDEKMVKAFEVKIWKKMKDITNERV